MSSSGWRCSRSTRCKHLLLFNIGEHEVTAGELKSRGYYQGSNVSYNLKKLVELGYMHHQRSEVDRRSVRVRLTEKGRRVRTILNELFARHAEGIDQARHDRCVGDRGSEHRASPDGALLDRTNPLHLLIVRAKAADMAGPDRPPWRRTRRERFGGRAIAPRPPAGRRFGGRRYRPPGRPLGAAGGFTPPDPRGVFLPKRRAEPGLPVAGVAHAGPRLSRRQPLAGLQKLDRHVVG